MVSEVLCVKEMAFSFLSLLSFKEISNWLSFSYLLIQKQRFNEQLLSAKHRLRDGDPTMISTEFLYSVIIGTTISFGKTETTYHNI